QQAVESLQSNRTIPVHLMDELVSQVPEGTLLRSVTQNEGKVTLVGLAQSNERISDLLRNLARESPWLARPELVEIKAVEPAAQPTGRSERRGTAEGRRLYEFSLIAQVRNGHADAASTAASVVSRQDLALDSPRRK
ncbi:MAG: PilN domain-containing protein, partial [Gammaproteobacteria bacterium]